MEHKSWLHSLQPSNQNHQKINTLFVVAEQTKGNTYLLGDKSGKYHNDSTFLIHSDSEKILQKNSEKIQSSWHCLSFIQYIRVGKD